MDSSVRHERPPLLAATPAARHLLRILLAEGKVVSQKLALRRPQPMGCCAELASNGIKAIECIERQTHEAASSDIQMPESDELEASRRITARWPIGERRRISLMTGYAMQGVRAVCESRHRRRRDQRSAWRPR